jgi:hypothetical protein
MKIKTFQKSKLTPAEKNLIRLLETNENFEKEVWRITESYYEKKRKEYRAEQQKINRQINKLHLVDEEYYLTSEYLLKLASKASKLFESSEPQEKRLLLKMTLQNLTLSGKKARYNWINPFDKIADSASRQAWLQALEQVRTFFLNQLLVPVSPDSIDVSAIFGYLKNNPVALENY